MQRLAYSAPNTLRIRMIAWFQAQHFQAQGLQTVRTPGGACRKHQVGLERDDAFDVGVQSATHSWQIFDSCGPVGIPVQADQLVTLLQGANGFRQRGQQTHYALRGLCNLQLLQAIVNNGDGLSRLQQTGQKKQGPGK